MEIICLFAVVAAKNQQRMESFHSNIWDVKLFGMYKVKLNTIFSIILCEFFFLSHVFTLRYVGICFLSNVHQSVCLVAIPYYRSCWVISWMLFVLSHGLFHYTTRDLCVQNAKFALSITNRQIHHAMNKIHPTLPVSHAKDKPQQLDHQAWGWIPAMCLFSADPALVGVYSGLPRVAYSASKPAPATDCLVTAARDMLL